MPKYQFKIEDPDGNLLRAGTGLFHDHKHAKEVLRQREADREGEGHADSVQIEVKKDG